MKSILLLILPPTKLTRTMIQRRHFIQTLAAVTALTSSLHSAEAPAAYRWKLGAPLLNPPVVEGGKPRRQADPTAIFADGVWHVFTSGSQYFALKELKPGMVVPPGVTLPTGQLAVPQVFFFRARKQWQMIGQTRDTTGRYPQNTPCLSTNARIDDPQGWSQPIILDVPPPEDPTQPVKPWNDFHVICDDAKAHLLATSEGRLWRSETKLADYPHGWSKPVIALSGDFLYASHTYRQDTAEGRTRFFLNLTGVSVETATKKRRQYQQSYLAERIEGPWLADAATWEQPFAGPANIRLTDDRWHGDLVHGEPLRLGNDERMILQHDITRFIFHGNLRDPKTGRKADNSQTAGLLERDTSFR
ncbi:MAG: non-reducing end alpha-L-arabinofuranosidase family hydrolase [Limisphaerales bacterium]